LTRIARDSDADQVSVADNAIRGIELNPSAPGK